jgi:hypothetical protein
MQRQRRVPPAGGSASLVSPVVPPSNAAYRPALDAQLRKQNPRAAIALRLLQQPRRRVEGPVGGARRPDLLQDKVTSFQADAQQPAADAAIRDAATVHATDAAVADANAVDAEGDGTIRALERAAATIRELEAALARCSGCSSARPR